jgi:glycosyltransferase involved in cell wall biosynthesis
MQLRCTKGLQRLFAAESVEASLAVPLLTIAIPTLNRLELMKRALASALAQTVPVEIIVSDNGSTDGTDAYLKSLTNLSVRRFRHEFTIPVQNHGWFIASQIRTDWVVFLSDDDELEPDFADSVQRVIQEQADVLLVYTGCDLYIGTVAVPAKVGPRFEAAADFLYAFLVGERNICLCATAFRVSDYRGIGRQPDFCVIGDMYYWTRVLARDGLVGCASDHLSNYFFYRPGLTAETNRTPALHWARESAELASRICLAILKNPTYSFRQADVTRARKKFLALTAANQLAWNALRGAAKPDLLVSTMCLLPLLCCSLGAIVRAVGSLCLPRAVLESRVLAHARRLARMHQK